MKNPTVSRRKFLEKTAAAGAMLGGTLAFPGILSLQENELETIAGQKQSGKTSNGFIDIHVHTHLPRDPKFTRPNGSYFPSPEMLIKMLDEAGIAKAVVLPCVSPECRYTLVTTEEILPVCEKYSDRLIPFCNFDPRQLTNSPKADFMPELLAYKAMGCKGVGEYFPNIPLDDPLNLNFFRQVEEVGLPLLFHLAPELGGYYGCYDEPGLPKLEKVLKMFPKLTFLGHSQVFWAEIGYLENPKSRSGYPKGPVKKAGRIVELMRNYQNLHGDLSAGSGHNAIARDPEFGYRFLEEFQDRLYFGSDICNVPQDIPQVAYFKKLKEEKIISVTAYEKIAWKNADKLLFG